MEGRLKQLAEQLSSYEKQLVSSEEQRKCLEGEVCRFKMAANDKETENRVGGYIVNYNKSKFMRVLKIIINCIPSIYLSRFSYDLESPSKLLPLQMLASRTESLFEQLESLESKCSCMHSTIQQLHNALARCCKEQVTKHYGTPSFVD